MKLRTITLDKLQTGDVLCFEKNSGISRANQIITRSHIGHTGIYINNGEKLVYESLSNGFHPRPIQESIDKHTVSVYIQRPLFNFSSNELERECKKKIGTKYYFMGLFYQLKHNVWGGWDGTQDLSHGAICSSIVNCIFNILTERFLTWYKDTPADIWENRVDFESFELLL